MKLPDGPKIAFAAARVRAADRTDALYDPCSVCGVKRGARCSALLAAFCSVECQRAAWQGHKALRKAAAAAGLLTFPRPPGPPQTFEALSRDTGIVSRGVYFDVEALRVSLGLSSDAGSGRGAPSLGGMLKVMPDLHTLAEEAASAVLVDR